MYWSRHGKPPLAARCCHIANDFTCLSGDRLRNRQTDRHRYHIKPQLLPAGALQLTRSYYCSSLAMQCATVQFELQVATESQNTRINSRPLLWFIPTQPTVTNQRQLLQVHRQSIEVITSTHRNATSWNSFGILKARRPGVVVK